MDTFTFEAEGLKCMCCKNTSSHHVAYLLYPMNNLGRWLARAAADYGVNIAVATGMDWDNDLTPWPAPGVPQGSPDFKGDAATFFTRVARITAEVESRLALTGRTTRSLLGVSLSGLFTLWQWPQSGLFRNILCLSGSFWYEGFMQWFGRQDFSRKQGAAFFLLGDKESNSGIKAFDPVGVNTAAIADSLRQQGVTTEFRLVPGNHYQHAIARLDMAMTYLASIAGK